MGRTVFLGDSHAAGYWVEPDQTVHQWEHNYGNSYSKEYDKDVAVYATPGACNKKYPIWLKSMLDRYDDIDEVDGVLARCNTVFRVCCQCSPLRSRAARVAVQSRRE